METQLASAAFIGPHGAAAPRGLTTTSCRGAFSECFWLAWVHEVTLAQEASPSLMGSPQEAPLWSLKDIPGFSAAGVMPAVLCTLFDEEHVPGCKAVVVECVCKLPGIQRTVVRSVRGKMHAL